MKNIQSYSTLFASAMARTKSFGFNVDDLGIRDKIGMTPEQCRLIQNCVVSYYTETGIQPSEKCICVHYELQNEIESILRTELYLTIGDIYFHPIVPYFHFSEQTAMSFLRNKDHNIDEFPLHCWFTSPAMEIVDLTIATKNSIDTILYLENPIDELRGYLPVVVGEKYLWQIGALRQ